MFMLADRMLQHPDITAAERTGYASGMELDYPCCLVCGEECEQIYRNRWNEIVGCDSCLEEKDAWNEAECFPAENAK